MKVTIPGTPGSWCNFLLETLCDVDSDRDLNGCLLVTFPFLQIFELICGQFHSIIRFVSETWLVVDPRKIKESIL